MQVEAFPWKGRAMNERLTRRVGHLANVFQGVLTYVGRGHRFRFHSDSNARGDLVMTMTVEEPEALSAILEPGEPRE
jgi:hypothetical protein